MQRHRNDMRHREALQRRYLGDPKYMTEEELDRYISERLGQRRASSLNFGDWRDLRARYRWIGEKLFDTGASCDPCFLTCGAFILFALDPSIEMLRFLQIRTASEYVKTFEKLVESNRHIPWEDIYEYFDETRYYQFNVLQDILIKYRDKLLKIDVNMFPNGRRLITHQKVPNHVIKELLNQKLHEVGYDIDNMTKKEVTTAISRYAEISAATYIENIIQSHDVQDIDWISVYKFVDTCLDDGYIKNLLNKNRDRFLPRYDMI